MSAVQGTPALPDTLRDWYPVAWQCEDDPSAIRIERTVSPFYDGERFAVRKQGWCLNHAGEWEWEPIPSSRDDAFYARCRFDSFGRAAVAVDKLGGGA